MNKRFTVLVAEDDPVFRRVITFSIEAAGMACQAVANGVDAKAILAQGGVDLLVTDHQMPLCSGLELIEHVRTESDLNSLPIILCTAKGFELDAAELSKTHRLLAVLRKPFSPRQMMGIVKAHIEPDARCSAVTSNVGGSARSSLPLVSCPPSVCHE
ncbi:MAG: response regulator [Planctomycetaceae bacterium]